MTAPPMNSGGVSEYFGLSEQAARDIERTDICYQFEYMRSQIITISQMNQGVSVARNVGVEKSSGDYILFIDPDDFISKDTFLLLDSCLQEKEDGDIYIFGFTHQEENEQGEIKKINHVSPIVCIDVMSNKDAVKLKLPYYLGYSLENMIRWGKEGQLSSQLEFGAVWRNLYRREFIRRNELKFNPKIKLNEDSMFNANCMSKAERIFTFNKSFYNYTVRQSGAFQALLKRGDVLVNNKKALLKEREKIVENLKMNGYDISVASFAGSNVMSCLELIVKCDSRTWEQVKEYIREPAVQESIRIMPMIKKIKVDAATICLKMHMEKMIFLAVCVAKRLGVSVGI